jgi:hypothetical protein
MKVREDFVTNSSSTSFIVSLKDDFNQKNFMKSIGIEGKAPLNRVFEDLFEAINQDKREIHEYIKKYEDNKSISEFLVSEYYDQDTINHVEKLITEGRKVYFGKLSSDNGGTAAEVYFCMESFLVCDNDIYFNGKIGGW